MLSQAVGYAATALGFIAAMGGKPALVKTIATACNIPQAYLAKIIHALARKKIVTTQRGVGGGVLLARAPAELTLHDLCLALDDPCVDQHCILGAEHCSDDRACPGHQFCVTSRERLFEFLRKTSIADIAAFETRRRWSQPVEDAPAASGTA